MTTQREIDGLAEAIREQRERVLAERRRGWQCEAHRLARLYRQTRELKPQTGRQGDRATGRFSPLHASA